MKKLFKKERSLKILVITLIVAMVGLGALSVSAFADQKTTAEKQTKKQDVTTTAKTKSNDETVYVITSPEGKEQQRIVSENGTLHYSGYEEYTMPVDINISYTLDGTAITPEELAGKSGHVTITLKYTNNIKSGNTYVPFMAVSAMVLDNENFSNVKTTNAKSLDDGNRNIVAGYAFPGMQESLGLSKNDIDIPDTVTVSADVTDFRIETIYSVVTSDIFSEMDLSSVDSMDDLNGQLSKLKTSVSTLLKGTEDLYEGTNQLVKGTNALAEGTDELSEGIKQVYDGTSLLASKTTEFSGSLTKLSSNSESIRNGVKKVYTESIATVDSNMEGLRTAGQQIPTLTAENYATVLTGVISNLSNAGEQYADTVASLKSAKTQLDDLNTLYQGVVAYTGGVDSAKDAAVQLKEKTDLLNTGAKEAYGGISLLRTKEESLISGAVELNKGAAQLNKGVSDMVDQAMEKLSKLEKSNLLSVLENVRACGNAAKTYNSFGGNGSYDSVSFIYKADGISTK